MKQLFLLIFLFIFLACQQNSKQRKAVAIFETTLGKEGVAAFDKLIPIVENELMHNYQVNKPDIAYVKFLEEVGTSDICGEVNLNIEKSRLESILRVFEATNLRDEIWIIHKTDSNVLLEFNLAGNYIKAFKEASKFNEGANEYYNIRNIAGNISYRMVANAILENEDVSDYFIKRLIVADFIYMNLICTNEYDFSIFDKGSE